MNAEDEMRSGCSFTCFSLSSELRDGPSGSCVECLIFMSAMSEGSVCTGSLRGCSRIGASYERIRRVRSSSVHLSLASSWTSKPVKLYRGDDCLGAKHEVYVLAVES